MESLITKPLNPFYLGAKTTKTTTRRRLTTTLASLDDFRKPKNQQLNLSVLRFTLGIPGLDESYLPRWIGYAFGSLLVLNHFVGSNLITPAQLRTEALGLSLAAFSVSVPYIGKFLKGSTLLVESTLPEGNRQIFAMSEHIQDSQKEDLAWGTYVLLKNTNTISVLISIQDALCVRGYWSLPEDATKAHILDWFEKKIQQIGLSDLQDTLYFPQSEESGIREMLPQGTRSFLIQPVRRDPNSSISEPAKKIEGFILLASSMSYAYTDRDRAWVGAIANKFRGYFLPEHLLKDLLCCKADRGWRDCWQSDLHLEMEDPVDEYNQHFSTLLIVKN